MTPLQRHEAEILHIVEWAYLVTETLDKWRRQ